MKNRSSLPRFRFGCPIDLAKDSAVLRNRPPGSTHARLLTTQERAILGCPNGSELRGVVLSLGDIMWTLFVPQAQVSKIAPEFAAQCANPCVILRDDSE